MANCWHIRIGTDTIEQAETFASKEECIEKFAGVARQLARFGQEIEASVHFARCKFEADEYPDFVLKLVDGEVICEKA